MGRLLPLCLLLLAGIAAAGPVVDELTTVTVNLWHDQQGVADSTLNTVYGHTPRLIDYLFGTPDLKVVASEVFLADPSANGIWGSDHFGVRARWRVAP